jgi:predicted nuclease of restriction endonuclease-like RecB superfamily
VLTADLVTVRRRGDELRLTGSDPEREAQIRAIASAMLDEARAHVGHTREDVEQALREVADAFSEDRRLAAAVGKLVRDGLCFQEADAAAAADLRRELFRRATAARRAGGFDRTALIAETAAARGLEPDAIDQALFADRPGAHRLLAVEAPSPAALAAGFALAEAQAVLLRATKVVAEVRAADAGTYRRLFRMLKFLRLLPLITRAADGHGLRVEIDGPLSLFQASAKYGLQLALALPAIAACDAWSLEADLRWGADRRPLRFRLGGRGAGASIEAPLPDELAAFVAAFGKADTGWRIDQEPAVLDLPGAGLCVPDLAFTRGSDGARVYLELLGFWSREAVFRRIDLVRAGLPHKILFAASKTLRVSEALLDESPTAALYVFSRVLSVRAVVDHLRALADGEAGLPATG